MMSKTIVFFILTFLWVSTSLALESKPLILVSQNREGDKVSSVYYDAGKKKMLVRVFKTKEKTLPLPQQVSHSIEIMPSTGDFKIVDDRVFDLSTSYQEKKAEEFILKYNKAQFVSDIANSTYKKCNTQAETDPLNNSGNAKDLSDIALNISDKALGSNDAIMFKVLLGREYYLLKAQIGKNGEITTLEFVDRPKEDYKIYGPIEGIAYVYQDKKPVIKVATENFNGEGGDFVVTLATPIQSQAEFTENVYKVTVEGDKYSITPRQLIASSIDYSNELNPSPGKDEKPTALGFKNFLANVVWGGGKEKTYKEIVKAGKEAINEDPLLKQYLKEADVERVAKKIVDEGTVIKKDAFSEKPKVMGIAYLYFSEELLKKAIMEQMPMSEADLEKKVSNVMENFRVCI